MAKKEEIIREINRVASLISPAKLTRKVFKRNSNIAESTVLYHFGSFNQAVVAAGLTPNKFGANLTPKKISDDELLVAIGDLWRSSGKRPTQNLMNAIGKYSKRPYAKRWGTFTKAVDEYKARFGEPQVNGISAKPNAVPSQTFRQEPVVIPQTYKPQSKNVARPKTVYGEPLDFRGLRYAPVNEQGVVYLFGMVSRELGFLIESVRTDFPDCEGKRCLDEKGSRWGHVRIEFELKSSNFKEHGHDPEQCDLIVCWTHDWAECPLEVLELRTELRKLRGN